MRNYEDWDGITLETRASPYSYVVGIIYSILLSGTIAYATRGFIYESAEDILILSIVAGLFSFGIYLLNSQTIILISKLDGSITISSSKGNLFVTSMEIDKLQIDKPDAFPKSLASNSYQIYDLKIVLKDGRDIVLLEKCSENDLTILVNKIGRALELSPENLGLTVKI